MTSELNNIGAMGPFKDASDKGWDRLVTDENIAIVALATVCMFLMIFNLIQYYSSRKSDREWRLTLRQLSDAIMQVNLTMSTVSVTTNAFNSALNNLLNIITNLMSKNEVK